MHELCSHCEGSWQCSFVLARLKAGALLPAPLRSFTTQAYEHHKSQWFFLHHFTWFCPHSCFPPYAHNTSSRSCLFLQGREIESRFICFSLMLLGYWGDTQKCSPPASRWGTARGNLVRYCRKSLSYCQFGTRSAQLGFPGHLDG